MNGGGLLWRYSSLIWMLFLKETLIENKLSFFFILALPKPSKTLEDLSCCISSVLSDQKRARSEELRGVSRLRLESNKQILKSSFPKVSHRNLSVHFIEDHAIDPHKTQQLPVQLRNALITHRHIIYPILLQVHVSENVLSQTIKPIKMEVNLIKGSDVSFVAKSLRSRGLCRVEVIDGRLILG